MNVLAVGASRHIGYHSAVRLLEQGATVTFLLRNPSVSDEDSTIQPYVKSGKARLVKGDALVAEDVRQAWAEAGKDGAVDVVLFSVGFTGNPTFSLTKGFVISPANLVTQALLTVLCTLPAPLASNPPKLIVLSATGVTLSSRRQVPSLMRPVYAWMISSPLADKRGAERVAAHVAGWEWNSAVDGEPSEEIIGKDWQKWEGLPAAGTFKGKVVVLRPAWLTDGECVAESGKEGTPYRAGPGEVSGYTVSRKDVAHFIVEGILKDWEKWGGKQLSIAY